MKRLLTSLFAGSVSLVGIVATPSPAHATELQSCGSVFLTADSRCEFRREQDCEETCEVVSVDESCAAEPVHLVRIRMHGFGERFVHRNV